MLDFSIKEVQNLIEENIAYFEKDNSEYGYRLHCGLCVLNTSLSEVHKYSEELRSKCHFYDFSGAVKGNGFRSFANISDQAIYSVFDLITTITKCRSSYFFMKLHYTKEVEVWSQLFASLFALLTFVCDVLLKECTDGNLLNRTDSTPEQLLKLLESISQCPFYGRCLGFQYSKSLHKTLKFLNINMCIFSELFYNENGLFSQARKLVFLGSKYIANPEFCARRTVDLIQYSSVDFIKKFWCLGDNEFFTQLFSIVYGRLSVYQAIIIPCEKQIIFTLNGTNIEIDPPTSSFESRPITAYLLSSLLRRGMPGEKRYLKSEVCEPSDGLIFHCHGGGFITQSTKGQEVYLRKWVSALNVPLFSVDYSLAPEAQFPRPLEEVFFAYIWVLNNFNLLGTTGKKIILTGDSAGGNLIFSLTMKCIEKGIRPPDGLLLIYSPLYCKIVPSPSKLLAVMDPMLPLGFALRCLKAYTNSSQKVYIYKTMVQSGENSEPQSISDFHLYEKKLSDASNSASLKSIHSVTAENITDIVDNPKLNSLNGLQEKFEQIIAEKKVQFGHEISDNEIGTSICNLSEEFADFEISDDPFLNPLLASDQVLKMFPHTSIVTVEFDFCLDDSVTMAKRLQSLRVPVTLDVLEKLPHGFMNLCLVSKDAHNGLKVTLDRLEHMLA